MTTPVDRRRQALTKDDLKEVVVEALEIHMLCDQHQFIKTLIEKEKRKQELWEKTKAHVFGWGCVAAIVFLANAFWHELISSLPFLKGE